MVTQMSKEGIFQHLNEMHKDNGFNPSPNQFLEFFNKESAQWFFRVHVVVHEHPPLIRIPHTHQWLNK